MCIFFFFPKCPLIVGSISSVRTRNTRHATRTHISCTQNAGEHIIRYDMKDEISCRLGPGGGRPGKETGAVSLVMGESPPSRGEGKTMTPEEATAQVLQQVQRTFLHLRDGERRFFDPIQLVEACRCLNLEYLVHQQNDASEFCDKLLDRVESGMKAGQNAVAAAAAAAETGAVAAAGVAAAGSGGVAGRGGGGGGDGGSGSGSGKPSVAALERLFGGTWVHQKIPVGCSHRTNRSEPFINLEVNIRGKESLQESLASFVESELMAGDNKVEHRLFYCQPLWVLCCVCTCVCRVVSYVVLCYAVLLRCSLPRMTPFFF